MTEVDTSGGEGELKEVDEGGTDQSRTSKEDYWVTSGGTQEATEGFEFSSETGKKRAVRVEQILSQRLHRLQNRVRELEESSLESDDVQKLFDRVSELESGFTEYKQDVGRLGESMESQADLKQTILFGSAVTSITIFFTLVSLGAVLYSLVDGTIAIGLMGGLLLFVIAYQLGQLARTLQ